MLSANGYSQAGVSQQEYHSTHSTRSLPQGDNSTGDCSTAVYTSKDRATTYSVVQETIQHEEVSQQTMQGFIGVGFTVAEEGKRHTKKSVAIKNHLSGCNWGNEDCRDHVICLGLEPKMNHL